MLKLQLQDDAVARRAAVQSHRKGDAEFVEIVVVLQQPVADSQHAVAECEAGVEEDRPDSVEQLSGRVVLSEFWATWCPRCRSTLEWLGELKRKHGDNLEVLALAVESPEDQIRSAAGALGPDLRWAITDAVTAQAFGDITAVPTLFLFDRMGKTARVVYGAPPDLHEQVGTTLDGLIK